MAPRARTNPSPAAQVAALERRMTLLGWLHQRLGYIDTRELLADVRVADEGFDADGRSHAFGRIASRASKLDGITTVDLERYDGNVRIALSAMNMGRSVPITLRYFQYLAALYAEMFLDQRFNCPDTFLASLNEYVRERNLGRSPSEPQFAQFADSDLDKLAFWMATGSGKTLLLHLNYRQFLHYSKTVPDNIVLITPNEGLSDQHIDELRASNIPCRRFQLDRGDLVDAHAVNVTEITKLVVEKRGEGLSVPVDAFEGRNLIFVDEGHKGSGGDAWRQVRDAIGETGFTFEYSATFGQALTAARNDALTDEYGKAIAFDYSYRHFYNDGHGKDFNILNLLQDPGEHTDTLLLANLLAFHEQHVVFRHNADLVRRYKLEQPLWALVGASVNAIYSESRRKRSDVLTAIRFLHRLLTDSDWAVKTIGELLQGRSGFSGAQGDLLEGKFDYLHSETPASIYADMLRNTLHAPAGGGLHLCDITHADGELGLKVAGAEDYFGLIYIGDTAAFKRLVVADDSGITLESDALSGSLFDGINRPDTTIEILIGARKFMEGWNSWRVSNMGLLNIGRSEGAQIIQMFGRGVRLRGLDLTLKRSSALPGSHPASVKVLEVLNIFALRANYMSKFREYLEREGVVAEGTLDLHLPIRTNWLDKDLVIPRIPEGSDYKIDVESVLTPDPAVGQVTVDLAGRAQTITSGGSSIDVQDATSGIASQFPPEVLDLVDWNAAYLDVAKHVELRGFENLAVAPGGLRAILEDPNTYKLVAETRVMAPTSLADVADLQQAVVATLRKYVDRLYRRRKMRWESGHMRYVRLDKHDANIAFNSEIGDRVAKYVVRAPRQQTQFIEEVRRLATSDELYDSDSGEPRRVYFDRHVYQPLLLDRQGGSGHEDIVVAPPGLNVSEQGFVEDMRNYWTEIRSNATHDQPDVYLLRNLSRGKGVGFFEESGFYPDFILWIKEDRAQRIVFVEPHGMMHAPAYAEDSKARLHERLPSIAQTIPVPPNVSSVTLDAFIVSETPFDDLRPRYDDGSWTREQFADKHILFREPGYAYIGAIVGA